VAEDKYLFSCSHQNSNTTCSLTHPEWSGCNVSANHVHGLQMDSVISPIKLLCLEQLEPTVQYNRCVLHLWPAILRGSVCFVVVVLGLFYGSPLLSTYVRTSSRRATKFKWIGEKETYIPFFFPFIQRYILVLNLHIQVDLQYCT
jgi:hypothetical protein